MKTDLNYLLSICDGNQTIIDDDYNEIETVNIKIVNNNLFIETKYSRDNTLDDEKLYFIPIPAIRKELIYLMECFIQMHKDEAKYEYEYYNEFD